MKRSTLFGAGFLLLSISLQAAPQTARVEPKSEIVLKRESLDRAAKAWREADHGLEPSILREDPAAATKRIGAAAVGRAQLDEARRQYAETLIRDAQRQLAAFQALAEKAPSGFPADEIARSLDKELDQMMARELALNRALAEGEPGIDPARQRLIDEQTRAQLEQISKLRLNLFEQKQTLAGIKTSGDAAASAGKVLVEHTRGVVRMLQADTDQAAQEAATWQEYYGALANLVKSREKVKPQPDTKAAPAAPAASRALER